MSGQAAEKDGERQGDFVGGKYLLEECLGIGGMGEVYRATNVSLGRKVAIKLLNKEHTQNEDDVLRFLREARAVAAVRHPNVVDVFDVARDDDGTPFIVQELLSGEDLEQYLAGSYDSKVSVAEALEIMVPVAEAVSAAHDRDVVHRDLKPANIFLAREGNRIIPKVLDFGACLYQTVGALSAKERRMLIGTPHYMAPEQITTAKDVDLRADVWAIGVILYEILAGENPFEAADGNAVLKLVRTRQVPRLRKLAPEVPEELEDLVHRCLDRDRQKRFGSAGVLATELEAIRDHLDLVRRPSGNPRNSRTDTPESMRMSKPSPARAPRPRRVDDREEPAAVAKPPPLHRVPSLVLKGKSPTKRRGASLLTLSSPDDDVSWDSFDEDSAPAVAPGARSASRPIEAAKAVVARTRSSHPPSAPRELDFDALKSDALLDLDLDMRPAKPDEPISSMPPVLSPALAAKATPAAEEPFVPRPGTPTTSTSKDLSREAALALAGTSAAPRGPAAVIAQATPEPPRSWTPRAKVGLAAAVIGPALVAFIVLSSVAVVTAPLGHAMRGDSAFASGVLAVVSLVSAAALASRALFTSRSPAMLVATIGSVLMSVLMIIVTFSSSEAVELEIPPAVAGIVPLVAPIVPFALGWLAFARAREVWLSRYLARDRVLFVSLASILLFAALELGPLGAVRKLPRFGGPSTTIETSAPAAKPPAH